AYAIGVAEPVSLFVNTEGTSRVDLTDAQISEKVKQLFDMRPHAIERRFNLRSPIYLETATYGHLGRTPRKVVKTFKSRYEGDKTIEVELFPWEKLDYVDLVKEAFSL
ncbi:MAG: methionine adenosyltransferase domain-containing protein, partial [Muribaculaceae bacterium]|nr:methionine adenosyltransferase domain-containing protein [Muribaculaceae bacterium]